MLNVLLYREMKPKGNGPPTWECLLAYSVNFMKTYAHDFAEDGASDRIKINIYGPK